MIEWGPRDRRLQWAYQILYCPRMILKASSLRWILLYLNSNYVTSKITSCTSTVSCTIDRDSNKYEQNMWAKHPKLLSHFSYWRTLLLYYIIWILWSFRSRNPRAPIAAAGQFVMGQLGNSTSFSLSSPWLSRKISVENHLPWILKHENLLHWYYLNCLALQYLQASSSPDGTPPTLLITDQHPIRAEQNISWGLGISRHFVATVSRQGRNSWKLDRPGGLFCSQFLLRQLRSAFPSPYARPHNMSRIARQLD